LIPIAANGESFEAPGTSDFWQPLIGDGAFAVTRAMIVFAITALLISVFLMRTSSKLSVVPSKRQFAVEGVYKFVRNSVGQDIIGTKDFKPFLPLLFSLFIVILVNNLFGVFPFIQFPTFSRLGFAIALTAVVYVTYHTVGIRRHGFLGWLKSFVPSGLPMWLIPLMFVLEFFTFVITRPLTLALRIFGNMFAGHLLLLVFILGGEYMLFTADSLVLKVLSPAAFLMGIVFTFFEAFVQVVQAYIFVMLTASYIGTVLADDH
jgi:F-type H+-transporting ATPase subunit a